MFRNLHLGMRKIVTGAVIFVMANTQINAQQTCNNTDPGTNTGDLGCVTFIYKGQAVSYTTVRGADGKVWLQQNLGSTKVAATLDDADSYGDLFQWGRWDDGHQLRNSATSAAPSTNAPDGLTGIDTFIIGSGAASWWAANATSDAWNASNAASVTSAIGADPCKTIGQGWKMPSQADWTTLVNAEGINNPATAFESYLKLPAAGYRSNTTGGFTFVGQRGYYWSSDTSSSGGKYLYVGTTIANPSSGAPRGQGESVRCVKDATALSTNEIRLNVAGVYPNPTNGILMIKADSAIENVNITNVVGQKINVRFSDNQINMQGFPNGIYIVELKLKNGQIIFKKIIKN
ncbi:major paralogous domain-containing protein/Por secretion system C-terminal sorting domain-containing protein [Chryseobacterium soldanellicola]|uniref:Major paralogous domain-containing protein/Por secretion system C-terminal sorting domain-containing protein n=1 Tax=Chryseobacterium soldanellicola TaxID=311333 RepID=A0A1H1BAB9_9FLAO|nr:T9SS type A sorting domain-containing protein [Chryseobacterium soldanellicola]SDQ48813.1 major paralogous domain-containing protein/Por secretion system C-terminal sorting domain-containing protein [Chryseobacterium soldanellicola]